MLSCDVTPVVLGLHHRCAKLASSSAPTYPKPLLGPWTATVGGKTAAVTYYGSAPDNIAALFQVNVQIPTDLTTGIYDLVIQVGNFGSQSGLTVAIK
jgi:uncharacterized protein (TIGR03437 family)